MMQVQCHHYILEPALTVSELISLFYSKSPRNFTFAGESHDFWEFIYIDKGKMLITAGEQQYVLKAGELAFHCPGEFHAVQACEDIPANFIVCAFVCDSADMAFFTHKIMVLDGPARAFLQAAIQEAGPAVKPARGQGRSRLMLPDAPLGAVQVIKNSLELLLITLYRQGHSVRIQQRIDSYAKAGSCRQLATHVRTYLENHVGEQLTLAQIGRALGYSVPQMKKLFKAETGSSIIDTFIRLKMDEAMRMIQEGNLNISQIAMTLGYDNPHYFSRLFKLKTDMTPTEYSRSIG